MKKISFIFFMLFIFSACTKKYESIDNKFDNSSFYDSAYHSIVEIEEGYYNIYNELLVFIDKKTLKPYLVSNQKYSIEDLLQNEDLKKNRMHILKRQMKSFMRVVEYM